MRLTDWIVENIATDKMLHFLVGAWFTSMLSPLGWIAISVTVGILLILSTLKELLLDDKADWWDLVAAMAGCATSALSYWFLSVFI